MSTNLTPRPTVLFVVRSDAIPRSAKAGSKVSGNSPLERFRSFEAQFTKLAPADFVGFLHDEDLRFCESGEQTSVDNFSVPDELCAQAHELMMYLAQNYGGKMDYIQAMRDGFEYVPIMFLGALGYADQYKPETSEALAAFVGNEREWGDQLLKFKMSEAAPIAEPGLRNCGILGRFVAGLQYPVEVHVPIGGIGYTVGLAENATDLERNQMAREMTNLFTHCCSIVEAPRGATIYLVYGDPAKPYLTAFQCNGTEVAVVPASSVNKKILAGANGVKPTYQMPPLRFER